MVADNFLELLEYALAISMIVSFLTLVFIITVAFRKIEEVEDLIATPGKEIAFQRGVFKRGLQGRWYRAMNVFNFFVFRRIPRYGKTVAGRMGDEVEPIARSLKYWAVLPFGLFLICTLIFFATGSILMAYDQ